MRKQKSDLMFAYRAPYGQPYFDEMPVIKKMAKAGVNTVCFFAGNTYSYVGVPYSPYPFIWKAEYTYDFKILDRQIADLVKLNPKIELICVIDLNTPPWLVRRLRKDSYHQLGNCAANNRWRRMTFDYLKNFLDHAEKNHADRITAYMLGCGKTIEWFDMCPEGDDFKEEAYVRWCKKNKIEGEAAIPTRYRRFKAAHGFLRDPEKDEDAMRFWKFQNELVAGLARDMIKETRKHIREEAQLGLFFAEGLNQMSDVTVGNLEYLKVFDAPGLDFVATAGNPVERLRTKGHGFYQPMLSFKHRKMHHMLEIDLRTHTSNRSLPQSNMPEAHNSFLCGWEDEVHSIAGLKREFAMSLINDASFWFFNIFGGSYKGKKVWDTMGKMKKIWDEYAEAEKQENAEILLVVDPESVYTTGFEKVPTAEQFFYTQYKGHFRACRLRGFRHNLNLIGAPYQSCCFDDLYKMGSLSRYKLIVFANLFTVDERRLKFLKSKILNNERTILWQYAPGIITNNKYDEQNVESLTGCKYGGKDLQIKKHPGWKSVYFTGHKAMKPQTIRDLAVSASVHIYAPLSMGVQANSRLLMIHDDVKKGRINIQLPETVGRVKELFSNKVVARDTDSWDEEFNAPDTRLFALE